MSNSGNNPIRDGILGGNQGAYDAVKADSLIVGTGGMMLAASMPATGGSSSTKSSNVVNNSNGYAHLEDSTSVQPGGSFTMAQKNAIIAENMKVNNGVVRSDLTGEVLTKPSQSIKGIAPPSNEWLIDHIFPKSRGGSGNAIRGIAETNPQKKYYLDEAIKVFGN